MKNRILQGGDSHPICLEGIKGSQLRSRQFRSEVRRRKRRRRRIDLVVNQRALED
jgi:hypothetical protein